jgi:hypothetical protein
MCCWSIVRAATRLDRSLEVLGTVVDALPWQDQAKSAIEMQYT